MFQTLRTIIPNIVKMVRLRRMLHGRSLEDRQRMHDSILRALQDAGLDPARLPEGSARPVQGRVEWAGEVTPVIAQSYVIVDKREQEQPK